MSGAIVFKPGLKYTPVPGLAGKVQRLTGAGRYRSALDELFAILAGNPADPEVLSLAMIVLSSSSTNHIQAAEPLGARYLYDRRLDPLYAVCSQCGGSWAASSSMWAVMYERKSTTDPAGLQCRNCGFTLCRNCHISSYLGGGVAVVSQTCPKCEQEKMEPSVYPTGRPPMQLGRRPKPVAALIVFREGPVPPGRQYIEELADARSPDALDDNAELIGAPVNPWPDDIESHARQMLSAFVRTGRIPPAGALAPEACTMQDESGTRVHLVKIYEDRRLAFAPGAIAAQPPDSDLARVRLPELRAAAERLPRGINRLVSRMLVEHLAKLSGSKPASPIAGKTWSALFSVEVLESAAAGLLEAVRKALLSEKHEWEEQDRPEMRLVLSSVPEASAAKAQAYFPKGYLAFVERQLLQASAHGKGLAHWVICSDGSNLTVHLTCSPDEPGTMSLLAQDLLTAAEAARGLGV